MVGKTLIQKTYCALTSTVPNNRVILVQAYTEHSLDSTCADLESKGIIPISLRESF